MPFSDVRGHAGVIERLQHVLAAGRLAPAYLFAGPAGIGKSLLMQRFLQALLCPVEDGPDSCGACPTCRRIASGTHPDVHPGTVETGKKLIGIGVVRALQRKLVLQPLEGKWKAAIIEDGELLTVQAQNAFLRTLEEPPGRTVICLAAPTARSLLPTIVSRCQVAPCSPLSEEECRAVVRDRLSAAEDPPALSDDEMGILVRLAGGSPGRALSLSTSPVLQNRRALLERLITIEMESGSSAERWGRVIAEAEGMTKGPHALPADDILWLYGSWAQDLVHAAWGRPVDHTDFAEHSKALARRVGPHECLIRLAAVDAARRALTARNLNVRLTVESALAALTGGAHTDARATETIL